MAFTVRRDTDTRYQDYKQAFTQWVHTPGDFPLIFVENSGFDLSELKAISDAAAKRKVEFLSFQCPPFDGSLGKGYGEMICLDYCLDHSEILRSRSRFLKVTGRYFLSNAARLLHAVESRPDADVICNLLDDLTWADSRAFGGSTSFLRDHLCAMRHLVNDSEGRAFENVLARAMHRVMSDGGKWALLPEPPQLTGVSGSLGRAWGRTPLQELKQQVRFKLFAYLLAIHPE